MTFDMEKPIFIKKQIYDAKTSNIYPAGDRPYNPKAIPEKYLTLEYCTQEPVTAEKLPELQKAIEVKPLSAGDAPTVNITASTIVIKESQLPPSPESNSEDKPAAKKK